MELKNHETLFYNAYVYYKGKFQKGGLHIKDGKILCFENDPQRYQIFTGDKVDVKGGYLIPGFVDLHTHGGMGVEFMNAGKDIKVLGILSQYYASTGTTTVIAGTYTGIYEDIKKSLINISKFIETQKNDIHGAEIAGINIEGPYISKEKCGAQNPKYIRKINFKEFDELIEISSNTVKLITIAPELDGALDAISYLNNKGITVSIGHSTADFETACKAADNGASLITHFFNGLNPLHHRNPGIIGAGFNLDKLTLELICDGYHVHPELIKLVLKTKTADRVCFITDSVGPAGCEDGEYSFGDLSVIKNGSKITLKQGGNLAGSCLRMIDAFNNATRFTGMNMEEIIPAFTSTPAKAAKIYDRKGSLEAGKDADIIILDNDKTLIYTYVKGIKAYTK